MQSYRNIFRKKMLFVYAFLAEIAFFIFSGMNVNYFGFKILDVLVELTKIMQNNLTVLAQAYLNQESMIAALSQQKIFLGLYGDLISLTIKMLSIILIVWIAFKGANWLISSRIAGKKINFLKYMVNFAAITLLFTMLISLMFYITAKIFLKSLEALPFAGGGNVLNYLTLALNIVLFYFLFTSYSLIGKFPLIKLIYKNFVIGIKKIHYLAPMFAIILIKFTIAFYILFLLFKISTGLMLLFSVAAIIPLLIWAKVFTLITVDKAVKK